MRRLPTALAAVSLLLLSACSSSSTATPTPAPTPAGPAPAASAGAGAGTVATAAECAPGAGPATSPYPGWPVPGRAQATGDMIPYIVSTQSVVGQSRFLFSLISSSNEVLAAADVPVTAEFYNLAADPATPVATIDAPYLDPGNGTGRGLYRTNVDFTCAGEWGLRVSAQLPAPSGSPAGASPQAVTASVIFDVLPAGTVPAIGSAAPQSDSLTATTLDEVKKISTDDDPDLDFYSHTIKQAVTSGKPSAILFATPAFCQTATCGPTLDHVKAIAKDFKEQVIFVNVEPYQLKETPNGLQPALDADGHLQPVQAVTEWGLPTEPYLFIVDKDGKVFAEFEGILGEDEVRAALMDVTAAS
ncbi:MAG: hypothetical protein U0869_05800 [Chloroflexota bacterium]